MAAVVGSFFGGSDKMDYKSSKWARKRKKILKRDRYLCKNCKRYGKMSEASVVHHVFPCEHYPEYEWEDDNLISLCVKCHNAMHDRDSHELTQLGIEWKGRVSPHL